MKSKELKLDDFIDELFHTPHQSVSDSPALDELEDSEIKRFVKKLRPSDVNKILSEPDDKQETAERLIREYRTEKQLNAEFWASSSYVRQKI